jgi:hypothetical protein
MKIYQVMFVDEYNNNWLLGLYGDLDDAIPDINRHLSVYGDGVALEAGDVKEYVSTFGSAFDTDLETVFEGKGLDYEKCDGLCGCYVRGFVLDSDSLEEEIARLKGESDAGEAVDASGRNLA